MSGPAFWRCRCRLPLAAGLLASALAPCAVRAVELNLGGLTCGKYENEVLTSALAGYPADPIDTVMWLFGFATARAGDRVLYGDSLKAFGFALDAECKNNPGTSLLDAVISVRSKRENPMDLTRLDCATFAPRHAALRKSDPESANTLTMWMFGYAVGIAGGQTLDAGNVNKFDAGLDDRCAKHPHDTLFDALSAPNPAVPRPPAAKSAPIAPGGPNSRGAPSAPAAPKPPAAGR